mmetsp:Transcript_29589/g.78314  ORF Transcript_29589/g.78314 Transcript_29589/m.78314 type:complete len:123 (-) Transcript_29589:2853-3221(-)
MEGTATSPPLRGLWRALEPAHVSPESAHGISSGTKQIDEGDKDQPHNSATIRPSVLKASTVGRPPSRISARASKTPCPMALDPQMYIVPDIFSIQCFTDLACDVISFWTYFFCPVEGREKAV